MGGREREEKEAEGGGGGEEEAEGGEGRGEEEERGEVGAAARQKGCCRLRPAQGQWVGREGDVCRGTEGVELSEDSVRG